ncbi:hypothetical protein [Roseomonas sp. GC11]|nr:hypothetical protein [Roseomonas sp. GC11]
MRHALLIAVLLVAAIGLIGCVPPPGPGPWGGPMHGPMMGGGWR